MNFICLMYRKVGKKSLDLLLTASALVILAPGMAGLAIIFRIRLELPGLITIRGEATAMVCEARERTYKLGRTAILT